jgi:DNA-binding transcriptional regulator LsrR (DeoR family)
MCIMMRMSRKMQTLTHAQELVRLRTGREPSDFLRERYVVEGRSQVAIADELGISRNTVAMWLREFGIERSEALVS